MIIARSPLHVTPCLAIGLAAFLIGIFPLVAATNEVLHERLITADLRQVQGPLSTVFKQCVGAGRANEGLRADWQRQLAYARKECGFNYIRMHGLFGDDMGVYREDKAGHPQYNWQYIDELYDFLRSIGMKPFVELGFMPQAMASGTQTIFWWRGNVTLPKDLGKWEGLIHAFVAHLKERYGDDEVRTWYFEVWNEPNLSGFFAGTQQDYFDLYAVTARAIKSVSPQYKVGGPATAGCGWIPEFINFCATNHSPVDFISTHTYGVVSGYLDENGNAGTVFSPDRSSISRDVIRVRRQIAESVFPKLELHFTEWSSSYTPFDPIHDSYHSAAFILDKLKNTGTNAQSMSYWVFTDIFEEPGPRWTPFHGGFGLINYQDINKPAFYANQFLNRLGGTELKNSDPASWVCTDPTGDFQALVWDFTITGPPTNVNNQAYYLRDLPSAPKDKVTLKLAHVPKGTYTLEVFKVGYRANDAYTAYLDLGSPGQLARAQVAQLKAASSGAPLSRATVKIAKDGTFKQEFILRENDVVLVTLKPQRK
jgi:xylan 1,4-beta-xylosidase